MSSTLLVGGSPASRAAIRRAVAGAALAALVAVTLLMTPWASFGLALLPVVVVVSLLIEPAEVGLPGLVLASVLWGLVSAFGTVTVGVVAHMAVTVIGGGPLPETPAGYVLFLGISLVTLVPIVAVPLTALGAVWTVLVRRLGTAL
jgi:hypothetical protein